MNCGGPVAWRGPKYGYSMFCSRECLSKSSYRKEKIEATMKERYGVSNPSQLEVVKQKKQETSLKKYGVSNPMQSDAVRKKLEATNLKKYGVKNPFADKDIIKRIKKTQTLKYGGMGNGSKQTSKKIEATNIQRHGWNGYNISVEEIKQLKGPQFREVWMKKHYPKTHEAISKINAPSWQEKIFMYIGGENIGCKICGKPTKFVNALIGYREYCSKKCCNADPDKKQNIKSTNLEKYGVKFSHQHPAILAKVKATMRERYGVDWATQTKRMQDALCSSQLQVSQDKCPDIICVVDGQWKCSCPHKTCNKCESKTYITPKEIHRFRYQNGYEVCTTLHPVNDPSKRSSMEMEICSWLDEWGIEYETSNRDVISPQELDIYIPSIKVAIECNGCYWHSTAFKSPKYHLEKFKNCEGVGIQLIQIWEDWMVRKPEIVKSFIQAKVGACHDVIYARKCKIVDVKGKMATQFYNNNHIQGQCKASHHIGLEYDGVLVACMSFSKRSKLSGSKTLIDGEWELIRFCNLKNHRVVGGASRLMKHFISEFSPTIITSYSANDISDGQLYKALGFEKFNDGQISYWYIEHGTYKRYHRSTFAKAGIVRRGWKDKVDNTWTERQVMEMKPFFRIYDAGTTGWRLVI
jgi:putative hef-like homing endonuclease